MEKLQWTVNRARYCIALLHPIAFSNGYNLHLGGGVLVTGHSKNDLDVIALRRPQTLEVNQDLLFKQMNLMGFKGIKNSSYPYRKVVKFLGFVKPWFGLKVDLIILDLLDDPKQTEPVYHPVMSQEEWDSKHWEALTEAHDLALQKVQRINPEYMEGHYNV